MHRRYLASTRLLALTALLAAPLARADDRAAPAQPAQPASQSPRIGLGVSLGPAQPQTGTPATDLYLPIDVGNLRIEPSLGIYSLAVGDGGSHESVVDVGCGVFYVVRPTRDFDFYVGPRLFLGFDGASDAAGDSAAGVDVRLVAAVGGEWFATSHLSIGAEAQLGWAIGPALGAGGFLRPSYTSIATNGLLFVRLYM